MLGRRCSVTHRPKAPVNDRITQQRGGRIRFRFFNGLLLGDERMKQELTLAELSELPDGTNVVVTSRYLSPKICKVNQNKSCLDTTSETCLWEFKELDNSIHAIKVYRCKVGDRFFIWWANHIDCYGDVYRELAFRLLILIIASAIGGTIGAYIAVKLGIA